MTILLPSVAWRKGVSESLSGSARSHLTNPKRRSLTRRAVHVTGMLTGSCLLILLMLALWNLAVTKWQHAHNPVPGSFYSVEGRQMHLYCSGTGAPAVIIEAGASADWLAWQGVQLKLAQVTRVCTYDRAGHGWSQPRSGSRDAQAIARELHALLDQAGVQRPLVLAGHSAGGLYVREYAREFPAEVAGAVLIDSSSPQQIDELPGWRASYEQDKRDHASQVRWQELRVWSGWDRLMGNCRNTPSRELRYLAGQYDAEMCRPEYVGGEDSELLYFETTCKQSARLASFGNIPLLIISQDSDRQTEGITPDAIAENAVWAREQEELKALSPLSWRVIAHGAGHGVQHDRLDVTVAEMTRIIGFLRGGPTPAFGTTTIE
jgi:pimeloyl-ACP methyl ester carboxylesterase